MEVKSYRNLIVWQKGLKLSFLIYDITKKFPKEELYGLVPQMRRCAVSIPSNIAEGRRRSSRKDYAKYIKISFGSGAELETQLEIAKYAEYLTQKEYESVMSLLTEVMKMLNAFEKSLR